MFFYLCGSEVGWVGREGGKVLYIGAEANLPPHDLLGRHQYTPNYGIELWKLSEGVGDHWGCPLYKDLHLRIRILT